MDKTITIKQADDIGDSFEAFVNGEKFAQIVYNSYDQVWHHSEDGYTGEFSTKTEALESALKFFNKNGFSMYLSEV